MAGLVRRVLSALAVFAASAVITAAFAWPHPGAVTAEPRRATVGDLPFIRIDAPKRVRASATVEWCAARSGECPKWHRVQLLSDFEIGPGAKRAPTIASTDYTGTGVEGTVRHLYVLDGDSAGSGWPLFVAERPGRYRVTVSTDAGRLGAVVVPVDPA